MYTNLYIYMYVAGGATRVRVQVRGLGDLRSGDGSIMDNRASIYTTCM